MIQRILCFIFGHKFYTVALDNRHIFDGTPRSFFGTYTCQRCGYQEDWQYDLPVQNLN